MQRHAIGIIGILLGIGALILAFGPSTSQSWLEIKAGCWRLGLFFGVWWLAYPQAVRLPRWIWIAIPVLLLILVLRPKLFLFALPVVIVLFILLPRPKRR